MFRKFISIFLIIIFSFIFIFSAFKIIDTYYKSNTSKKSFENIRSDITDEKSFSKYDKLKAKNSDFIGWLSIDETNISYPVMQSKYEPQYYLKHNFNKEYDYHGTPFLDANCDIESSDNLIIYGHNMRDNTMFNHLKKFKDPSFCEKKPLIMFETINKSEKWQVICVFKISGKETESFPYHTVNNFDDLNLTVNEYLSQAKKYSIWSDDTPLDKNAKLLTLSTCEYSVDNGRLVVIAKKIS